MFVTDNLRCCDFFLIKKKNIISERNKPTKLKPYIITSYNITVTVYSHTILQCLCTQLTRGNYKVDTLGTYSINCFFDSVLYVDIRTPHNFFETYVYT